jgi:STE24 endopeptidase
MHWFTALFVLLLVLATLVRSWLNQRQVAAVRANRARVPDAFAAQIDLAAHQKAADYTIALAAVERWDTLLDTIIVLLLTLGGGLNAIDRFWADFWADRGWSPLWHGGAVTLSVLIAMMIIGLPMSIWRTFGVEARFGFNRTTVGLFIADLFKGLAVGLAIGGPIILVVLFLMQRAGDLWWLYAWAIWVPYTVFVQWLYPAVIAPLFNKFTPVADGTLKERTEALLTRCGFTSKGVFVMDGSRRSAHGNAFFTGVGRNKRIVFFDTLIERLPVPEVEAVLAHELGHFRLHHIRSRLILSIFVALGAFALLHTLAAWPDFYRALGVAAPSSHMALLLFMFALPSFTFFLTPLGAWWSRRHEFEADEFASRYADPRLLAGALVTLYRDNATTLTPDTITSAFYDSHPPALIRIGRLLSMTSASQSGT